VRSEVVRLNRGDQRKCGAAEVSDPIPTSPENDRALAEWHQKRFIELNRPKGRKSMNDQQIESEIVAKGLTAPRVTPEMIDDAIVGQYFFTADKAISGCPVMPSLALLTICVLVLRNGFTVTGESACASPENFDADIGRKIARQHAIDKVWMLEGYLLKSKLAA
jgi:hypothetical protein